VTSFLVSNPANFQDSMYGDLFGATRVGSYLSWIGQYTHFYLSIPGDANIDGYVNILDLGALANDYGMSGKKWGDGDFNGDGLVNIIDLGDLAANYGRTPQSVVPEPATLCLLAMGALAAMRRRR
jgi:hypothetical protein